MQQVFHIIDHLFAQTDQPHRILVGLSGGADSVYLLTALHQYAQRTPLTIHAAHLNHGWRTSALQDQLFCQSLCAQLQIPLTIEHASNVVLPDQKAQSKEDLGRRLRRAFFERLSIQEDLPFIALAHHQDDQIETFFIRLARGSTIDGLRCMRPIHGKYIRPLLHVSKSEIVQTLADLHISYVEDESNHDTQFLRNRIRHNLIPSLQQIDNRLPGGILKSIHHFDETFDYINQQATHAYNRVFNHYHHEILCGSIDNFLAEDPYLQNFILINALIAAKIPHLTPTRSLLDEIRRFMLHSNAPTHQIFATTIIIKEKNCFRIIQK